MSTEVANLQYCNFIRHQQKQQELRDFKSHAIEKTLELMDIQLFKKIELPDFISVFIGTRNFIKVSPTILTLCSGNGPQLLNYSNRKEGLWGWLSFDGIIGDGCTEEAKTPMKACITTKM